LTELLCQRSVMFFNKDTKEYEGVFIHHEKYLSWCQRIVRTNRMIEVIVDDVGYIESFAWRLAYVIKFDSDLWQVHGFFGTIQRTTADFCLIAKGTTVQT
jgi:hypothetical protein